MIGIKGVAKKPVTDATATSDDVSNGKIFYNNDGRQVGSSSGMSLLKSYRITMDLGTLVGSSPIKYEDSYLATTSSIKGNNSINISDSSWSTGYFCPERRGTSQDGYIIKSISIDSYTPKNTCTILTLQMLGSGNSIKRIYIGSPRSAVSGNYAIKFGSYDGLLLTYTDGVLKSVSTMITKQEYTSYSNIGINIYIYKEV